MCLILYSNCLLRYRRDARSLDEDEEMWFNDDEDDDEGEPVEKSRAEDDFSDTYGKYMEAKKGMPLHRIQVGSSLFCRSQCLISLTLKKKQQQNKTKRHTGRD